MRKSTDLDCVKCGMFSSFYPNTEEGERAWNMLNDTVGCELGKVLTTQVPAIVRQIKSAGYTVSVR